jgi:hypothetical protein
MNYTHLKDTGISASERSQIKAIIFISDITVFKESQGNSLPLKKAPSRCPGLTIPGHIGEF